MFLENEISYFWLISFFDSEWREIEPNEDKGNRLSISKAPFFVYV